MDWRTSNLADEQWTSAASSADGTKLICSPNISPGPGGVWVSTDSGITWTTNASTPWYWRAVASSADGKFAAVGRRGVYTSSDSGATWVSNSIPNLDYDLVASSADGSQLVVAGSGVICLLKTTPTPRLNLTVTDNNVVLSWLVPSAKFVLQQCSDSSGGNWSDVTNSPITMNLTNLHYEITLPLSNGSFYRLKGL
jgi:hypothetical protein